MFFRKANRIEALENEVCDLIRERNSLKKLVADMRNHYRDDLKNEAVVERNRLAHLEHCAQELAMKIKRFQQDLIRRNGI